MFYNPKKLVDEKVLQQYFFESFMLAVPKERKKLLPLEYQEDYSKTVNVKGLNPEVRLKKQKERDYHVTDFVLYPTPGKNLKKLNIELKWDVNDFENQKKRFEFYNGVTSFGFVVAIRKPTDNPSFVNEGKIPVVYLDPEDFKRWFVIRANSIVSQTLAVKFKIAPTRLTGYKYWVVHLPKKGAYNHYTGHKKKNHVWAFRDYNNPSNIMKILDGDYVVFVKIGTCKPSRALYPYIPKKEFNKSRKSGNSEYMKLKNDEINWNFDLIEIFKVKKGYHLNYSDKSIYYGFDEKWMETEHRLPEEKTYTQFITFHKSINDQNIYEWNKPFGFNLDRKIFKGPDKIAFVDAVRLSSAKRGDAIEISNNTFNSILHILKD